VVVPHAPTIAEEEIARLRRIHAASATQCDDAVEAFPVGEIAARGGVRLGGIFAGMIVGDDGDASGLQQPLRGGEMAGAGDAGVADQEDGSRANFAYARGQFVESARPEHQLRRWLGRERFNH
jgi:hypothetical protein